MISRSNQYVGPEDRQCAGKRGWVTKGLAKRALLRARKTEVARDDLAIYRCPHCRFFHVGHKPGKKAA